jgi:hypothetical protein
LKNHFLKEIETLRRAEALRKAENSLWPQLSAPSIGAFRRVVAIKVTDMF